MIVHTKLHTTYAVVGSEVRTIATPRRLLPHAGSDLPQKLNFGDYAVGNSSYHDLFAIPQGTMLTKVRAVTLVTMNTSHYTRKKFKRCFIRTDVQTNGQGAFNRLS